MTYLKKITFDWENAVNQDRYPFNIPALRNTNCIDTDDNVIFFIGENGTGKSTLLESIAFQCDFGIKGGSRNSTFENDIDDLSLGSIIQLTWLPQEAFFLDQKHYLILQVKLMRALMKNFIKFMVENLCIINLMEKPLWHF